MLEVHRVSAFPTTTRPATRRRSCARLFPQRASTIPKTYLRFAFGAQRRAALPRPRRSSCSTSAAICCTRRACTRGLKGRAATYKFSRRAYRTLFDRAFAVDAKNARAARGVGHARANASSASATSPSTARCSKRSRRSKPGAPRRRHSDHAGLARLRSRES